ncbi:hypothetical protein GUITHDRAFT_111219 [Guillardia theta CCMP2712]|uniref:Uncharacterized protein n=1 Tax=Guillardia theta (strain CCMP2712) TaxID=905079 RepID=L1J2X6_GUITC|nr:hypothetical protein GUITHDRAFT_111219 [Guillardia theta CCMP2712]EKX42851.1 hypothetical protein GUITHDRAFT_111219 [Guillardia theta CCMP2712]|eukprot:XP_005829831.1 hypothetical protein GUITHDRAFT_111219 [Guillardia theta CCMP2712]
MAEMTVMVEEDAGKSLRPGRISSQPNCTEEFPQVWLDYLVESTKIEGDRLQNSLEAARTKIFANKSFEILCSSHPFTWFLSVRIFQAGLAVIAFLFLFLPLSHSATWSLSSISQPQGASRFFRFTARKLQNGLSGPAITSPGIQSFGVLRGDCLIPRYPLGDEYVEERQGASVTLRLDASHSFDGWYFLTSNSSNEFNPVEFTLESSSDGEHWKVYVMQSMQSLDRVVPVPVGQDVLEQDFSRMLASLPRNQLIKISWNAIKCRWPAYARVLERLFKGLGILLAVACAHLKRLHASVPMLCLGYFLSAAVGMSEFIVTWSSCNLEVEYAALIESLMILLLFPCPLVVHECLVLELGAASSAILLGVEAALRSNGAYMRIVQLLFFLVLMAIREYLRASSRKSAMNHQAELEKVWEDILSQGGDSSLRELHEVAYTGCKSARKHLRQFCLAPIQTNQGDANLDVERIRALEAFSSSKRSCSPSTHESFGAFTSRSSVKLSETNEITSFDQLYAQGVVMQKVFVDKLVVIVEKLQTSHGCIARFHETPMKSFEASYEKILRKYHGAVARHTDLVRQSIVFERIQDITECLRVLFEDRGVVIVSLTNRLAVKDEHKHLGQVRDVCLKIRLFTEQSRFYGTCAFVCELRLVLARLQAAATSNMLDDLKSYRRIHQIDLPAQCSLFLAMLDSFTWLLRVRHHKIRRLSRVAVENLGGAGEEAESLNSLYQSAPHCWSEEQRHKDLLRQRCLIAGNILGARLKERRHAVRKTGSSSVLFTSIPCTLAIQKVSFKVSMVIVGIFYVVHTFGPGGIWYDFAGQQVFQVQAARMKVLQQREDRLPAGGNYSLKLGWILNGCKVSSAVEGVEKENNFYFSFKSFEAANAFYFITDSRLGTEGLDPVRFQLEVTTSSTKNPWELQDSSWRLKAGTRCKWDIYTTACIPFWEEAYPTTLERGAENEVTLVAPLYEALDTIFYIFPVIFGLFTGSLLSVLGKPRTGIVLFSFSFCGPGFFQITSGIIHMAVDGWATDLVRLFFEGFAALISGLLLVFWEEKFVPFLPFDALMNYFAVNFHYFLVLEKRQFQIPVNGSILLLGWLIARIARRIAIVRAWQGIKDDSKHYNEVWRALTTNEESMAQVTRLKETVGAGHKAWRKGAICQVKAGEQEHSPSLFDRLLRHNAGKIACLDQLYNQAMLLELAYLRKVKELLKKWGGLVQDVEAGEEGPREVKWVRYEEGNAQYRHSWASLKGFDRAIEKLSRSYKGEVWRLLDVVRQCIVFESIEDITRCFRGICEDEELVILRVKNRFDPEFTSQQSGAYRDLCLNVRLDNEETRRLGVNSHVCELQLSLKDYKAWVIHSHGHRRYVEYRNTRGE